MYEKVLLFLIALPVMILLLAVCFALYFYIRDKKQSQHSILKTHPIIGRLRYMFEMIGPEMRQYLIWSDKEGKPVDRDTQSTIAKAGKYASTVIGFGSKKDFTISDFYLSNSMFPKNVNELRVDNSNSIHTHLYKILHEGLVSRKEKRYPSSIQPWYLTNEDAVVIGPTCKHPFPVKGLVGISAMSYGALSKSAVKALAQGVAISGGSFMNTGEGGISPYHLSKLYVANDEVELTTENEKKLFAYIKKHPFISNFKMREKFGEAVQALLDKVENQGAIQSKQADLIFQVGSGLFGARKDGKYCEETFTKNANRPEVKAIEIKLAQGAKVRGGKLPKEKITPEISEIRGVPMGKDVESPNRFPLFSNMEELFTLIMRWKELTGKPVGIKVVAGSELSFEELAAYMKKTNQGPDFITIDGGEGGTGATYQEMADTLGLPIYSGLMILHDTLSRYGIRDRVKILASGMLATADKMAIALALGADLIYVARAAMNSIGCLNSYKCNSNHCPVGITSHLPHLESGLVVEEKRFRTANYLATMRQGLFMLGASCGLESPTEFSREHVTYRDTNNSTKRLDKLLSHSE